MSDVEKVKLNSELDGVSSAKFLGFIIDENLTWKNHSDAISKTISRNTGMLTKLKHFVSENILYSLYCTLILPYGVYIWGNSCKIYLDKMFKLQKWAIRTILANIHYRSHTGPPFLKDLMFLMYMISLNSTLVEFKDIRQGYLPNQLPPIFSTYFTKHVQTYNYPTRSAQDYSINKKKNVFWFSCAIRNCGPSFWNSLDKIFWTSQNQQTLPKSSEISFTI